MSIDKESLRASIPTEAFYREYLGEPAKSASQGSTYFCKFHDDRKTPNFFVFEDGRFKCFACNEAGDIFSFHQKTHLTSFGETFRMLEEKYDLQSGSKKQSANKKIVHTWTYHDEDGTLLFEVVKTNPKSFLQRSPNGEGGWQWNLNDVRRVVYRLPELLGSEGYVYITEGEKDADRLIKEGLVATTSPGGAGKWRDEYNEWFKGRDVIVLPDNDDVGRNHASQVADSLHELANSVKIIKLPDLQDHGDVSDYLEKYSAEELLALVEESPHYEPAAIESYEPFSADLLEWEAPILPNELNTPDIPTSILPGWLRKYAEAVSENAQTPSGLAVMMGLATIATCVQKCFEVSITSSYSEPLSYWAMVAMEPGTRKTAVLQAMTEPLSEWERMLLEETKEERSEVETKRRISERRIEKLERDASNTDDELERKEYIREIGQLKESMPEALPIPRLFTTDVTPERLQSLMAEQGERMGVLSDEGGIFEVISGLYSNGKSNIDIFLKSHAGSPVRVDRGGRTVIINKPALSFGLAIQPQVLNELGQGNKKRFRGLGTLARFMYLFPRSNVGYRDMSRHTPIPKSIKAAYRDGIFELLNIQPIYDECGVELPRLLKLSKKAHSAWIRFSQCIESRHGEGREYANIQDWTSKLAGAALRVAGLLHVVTEEDEQLEINLDTIDRAIQLCGLLIPHAQYAFGKVGSDQSVDDAKAVIGWIKKQGVLTFKRTDCHKDLRSRFTNVEHLIKAMKTLSGWNVISEPENIKTEGSNRSTVIYRVNPHLLTNN
jgi:hypothetical protein